MILINMDVVDEMLNKKNKILLDLFVIFLVSIFVFCFIPLNEDNIYVLNYIFDSFYLFIILILLAFHKNKYGFDMFEPIYFVSFIYTLLYFVAPIYDIITGNYSWFGYFLFQYGIKASFIAFIGYLSFFIVYEIKLNKYITKTDKTYLYNRKNIVFFSFCMYIVALISNIFYLVNYCGVSIIYVLTLGFFGHGGEEVMKENIGFLSMLSYSLPTIVLLYWEYGKIKLLKFMLFVPMIALQITTGFRFFVIQIFFTFFAYYYIRKNRRPNLKKILQISLIAFILVTFMTLYRDSIRSGDRADLHTLNIDTIVESIDATFWENLRIYKNFYGVVGVVPERYPYYYGKQIIQGTIIMVIPRILWNNKPSMSGRDEGLDVLIGPDIGRGQAVPNICEYYSSLGYLGVIICMGIIGFLMRKMKQNYMLKEYGALNNIIFASVVGAMLQVIIRGYTPSNFWYVIFLIIPVWIVKISCRKKY